ncbi:MAG TPA: GDSL-type esterase/lipase family protein, partial [Xanthobacteraceae bacterium]|nr:GDSL-type esterase/lipase family protein [Xanthobacteraceae bacterium]
QQTSGNRTISVRHNSLGLRERELSDVAPDRFLFLGDSFTYGYDAEANERFSDLLQKALPRYGIVNAGVSGYGTDQQFLLMKRLWNEIKPKYVVLTFCVDNDRDDNTSSYRYRKYHKPYFVRTSEGEWQVRGYPLPRPRRDDSVGGTWLERFALVRFAVDAYRTLRNREIIVPDPTEDVIGMMRRTAEARGAHLVVGLQRHEPRLETYLQAQRIPYTTFDDAPGYPVAGWHWTPEGNAVVAKKYLALFAEIGIPSDPAQPRSELPPPVHIDADGRQLIATTPSVLSPSIWLAAAQALPGEFIGLGRYLQNWSTAVQDSRGLPRVGVALLVLTVLAIAMAMLWFWWQRRSTLAAGTPDRFSKALSSFGVFLCLAFATPLLTITLLEATEVRMIEISYGFVAGVVIAAFGRAVALGVFAPDAPRRRLIAVDDVTARSLASHLVWGTRALGVLVLALAVHKALAAPAAMSVATNMLFALVIGALLLHLLLSQRSGAAKEKTPGVARWLRGLGWLVLGVIAIALVAGYPTFGAFVAARLISISAIFGGLYLLLALTSALFAERLAVDTPYGRELAADFGVSTPWLGFAAILACAAMGLAVMLAALVLYIGPW